MILEITNNTTEQVSYSLNKFNLSQKDIIAKCKEILKEYKLPKNVKITANTVKGELHCVSAWTGVNERKVLYTISEIKDKRNFIMWLIQKELEDR